MTTISKRLLTLSIASLFLLSGAIAHAQATACPTGSDNDCPNTQICNPDTKLCMAENNDGLYSVGDGPCANDNECRGTTTQCNTTTSKCEYDPNATQPAAGGTSAATGGTSAATTGASPSGNNFVPLTNLPTFKNITNQPDLTAFFNALYGICIGIAATLAVIQITIAGVMWMGGDSVTETKQAKTKISQAVLGLVLVLSPVLVFSIINPSILSLKINGLSGLQTSSTAATTAAPVSPSNPPASTIESTGAVNTACTPLADGTVLTATGAALNQQEQCCAHQTSTTVQCSVQRDYKQNEFCSCSTITK